MSQPGWSSGRRSGRRRSATSWSWVRRARGRPRSSSGCWSRPGVVNRAGSTEDGTTVCDFDEVEHRQQRSVGLALAPLVHDGVKVNLLDAPGYVDFVGEVRAGLRAADCALFVIAANEGVDEQTRALWRECADVGMPRAVVVTKLDHARADVDGVVAQARRAFGERVLPVHLHEGGRLVDLLDRRARARGPAGGAHRGHHRGVRGRDPDGALPRPASTSTPTCSSATSSSRSPGDRCTPSSRSTPPAASAPGSCSTSSWPPSPRRSSTRCRRSTPPPVGRPRDPVRPVRSAGRGGGQDDHRPLRRAGQPGPGLLRDRAAGRDGPRVRAPVGRGPPRPTRRRATRTTTRWSGSGRLSVPLGKAQRPAPAVTAGDVCADRSAAAGPRPATPLPRSTRLWCWSRGRCPTPSCRWRSRSGPRATRTGSARDCSALPPRTPRCASSTTRDPPDRAVDDGRGPRGRAARPARAPLRRRRRGGRAPRPPAGDVRAARHRPRPARQAERRARPVRRVHHRGRTAPAGQRVRVRRPRRRRCGAPAVHPLGREGGPVPDGPRGRDRPPDGGHQGDPDRRQGPQRRLLRHGVPGSRGAGAARRRDARRDLPPRAGRRGGGDGRRRPGRHGHG